MTLPEPFAVLLILASLSGLALALSRGLRLSVEAALLPAIAVHVIVLYAFAMTGVLAMAPPVLVAGGLLCGIGALALDYVPWRARVATFGSPGFVLLLATMAFAWLRSSDAHYAGWDEFSHWGLMVKWLSLAHRLPEPGGFVALLDYPPGSGLFQYYVVWWTGFSEGMTYFAQSLLVLSAVGPLVQGLRWRQAHLAVCAIVSVYLLTYIIEAGPHALQVDLVIGTFWGATLAAYVLNRTSGIRATIALALPVTAVPLLKDVGWSLVLLSIGTMVLAHGCQQLIAAPSSDAKAETAATRGAGWGLPLRRVAAGAVIMVLCLGIGPFIARATWKAHLVQINAPSTFVFSFSLDKLRRSFSPETATPRDRVTLARFRDWLWNEPLNALQLPLVRGTVGHWLRGRALDAIPPRATPTMVFWLAALSLLGIAAALLQPDRARMARAIVIAVMLTLGCVLYMAGHLTAYLYAFSEYEGTRLASFGRYMGIYLIGWVLATLALLVSAAMESGGRARLATTLVWLSTAGTVWLAPYAGASLPVRGPSPLNPQRATIMGHATMIKRHVSPDDTVFLIYQHTTGFEHRMMLYELAPTKTGPGWSVGSPAGPDDAWTSVRSSDQFAQDLLQCCTHLYLGLTTPSFWKEFGARIPEEQRTKTLFKVGRGASGELLLTPLE